MSFFACQDDPAVQVRAIHRVARIPPEARQRWQARCRRLCDLAHAPSLEALLRWLASCEGRGYFGYYEEGRFYQATVKAPVMAAWLMQVSSLALADLDVTVLHQMVVPELLGRTEPSANHWLTYTPDPSEALGLVDRRQAECAWFLRGIPLGQVFALASQGLTLPQKSTYFYPKLLSGLLINPWN